MFLTPRKPQAQVWVRPGRDPGSHLWAARGPLCPLPPQQPPGGAQRELGWLPGAFPRACSLLDHSPPPPRPQQMPAAGQNSAEGSGPNLLRAQG